jgi:hypothetical protein
MSNTEQSAPVCETCRWWDRLNTFEVRSGATLANCQAKSPRVIERDNKIHTVWPTTRPEQGCGAWRAMGVGAAAP